MKVYILDGPAIGKVVEAPEHISFVMVKPELSFRVEDGHLPIDSTFAYYRYRVVRRTDGDAEGHLA